MPTTRKQKKARKSRETDILSDIINLDIMFGGNKVSLVTLAEDPIVSLTTLQ